MSDPFQPCERKHRVSLECLKVFAETGYPFIFSTKGVLLLEREYVHLIKQSNCVAQISLISKAVAESDETGAPSYETRLRMIQMMSAVCKRVIVRIQPYRLKDEDDVLKHTLKDVSEAGAYGVIVEGMKFFESSLVLPRERNELIKLGAERVFRLSLLQSSILRLRAAARSLKLRFYVGENRLRFLGDSVSCCGADGLEGFTSNRANLNHVLLGDLHFTPAQKEPHTCTCFKTLAQETHVGRMSIDWSYEKMMNLAFRCRNVVEIMGVVEETKSLGVLL